MPGQPTLAEGRIARHLGWSHAKRPSDDLIRKTIAWTWKVKLSLSLERDLFSRLREEAEAVAIKVFADNLRELLLSSPLGQRAVMGAILGAMGVVVLAVAILPLLGVGGSQIFKAETPGPMKDAKLTPRIASGKAKPRSTNIGMRLAGMAPVASVPAEIPTVRIQNRRS